MSNTISLELQKVIINSIENIAYLKQNDIKIFTSIPNDAKRPYIKISNISMNSKQNVNNLQTFTIDCFIATDLSNNCQILEIMENLYKNIAQVINNYTIVEDILKNRIYNVYNINYSISEDLQNSSWIGHFYFDIDVI